MNTLAIQIETTGLDPEKCSIIEFAAVIRFDGTTYSFQEFVKDNAAHWESGAIKHHGERLDEWLNDAPIRSSELCEKFSLWLAKCGVTRDNAKSITLIGNHYHDFIQPFLCKLEDDFAPGSLFARRTIDVGSMYCSSCDDYCPGLYQVAAREGIDVKGKKSDAMFKAWAVHELVHRRLIDGAGVCCAIKPKPPIDKPIRVVYPAMKPGSVHKKQAG